MADRIDRDRKALKRLDHIDGTASDGTSYQLEFEAFWDDKPGGNIRVIGDLSAEPQIPLLGFIYRPDCADCFIMRPDGTFIGEDPPDSA